MVVLTSELKYNLALKNSKKQISIGHPGRERDFEKFISQYSSLEIRSNRHISMQNLILYKLSMLTFPFRRCLHAENCKKQKNRQCGRGGANQRGTFLKV